MIVYIKFITLDKPIFRDSFLLSVANLKIISVFVLHTNAPHIVHLLATGDAD